MQQVKTKIVVCFASEMKSRLIPDVKCGKIFTWSYLAMEELIMSPLNTSKGITIATESPYGYKHINLLRRSVLRQLYGRNVELQCPINGTQRYSYGYSKMNAAVNTDPMNSVTKPFGYYLQNITNEVNKMLIERKTELDLEWMDFSTSFNHCTALLYYADPSLKKEAVMPFHCDITYNHKGGYVDSKNEQVENTPTVIISLGDSRYLNFQCQICMINKKTGRMNWVVMKGNLIRRRIQLADKTIFVLNTIDERPAIDPSTGCFLRYQHGNVVVNKSTMSCAWVLRVVKNIERYNDNNQLMTSSVGMTNGISIMNDSSEHELYHENIQKLFKKTFAHYRA